MKKYDTLNILKFIPFGKDNAVSMTELSIRMNCDKRTVRNAVYQARIKGALVCSTCEGRSSAGYYQPLDISEVRPYISMQRSRINSALQAIRSAEEYIEKHEM